MVIMDETIRDVHKEINKKELRSTILLVINHHNEQNTHNAIITKKVTNKNIAP